MPTTRCSREGCDRRLGKRTRDAGHRYCCPACSQIDLEFTKLQRSHQFHTPEGTEAWTALVDVADRWSEYLRLRGVMHQNPVDLRKHASSPKPHGDTPRGYPRPVGNTAQPPVEPKRLFFNGQ